MNRSLGDAGGRDAWHELMRSQPRGRGELEKADTSIARFPRTLSFRSWPCVSESAIRPNQRGSRKQRIAHQSKMGVSGEKFLIVKRSAPQTLAQLQKAKDCRHERRPGGRNEDLYMVTQKGYFSSVIPFSFRVMAPLRTCSSCF